MRTTRWMAYDFTNPNIWVSCTPRTCQDPVGHTSNSTITSCSYGTTEHTEDEGLGLNISVAAVRQPSVRQETTMARAGTSRRTSIREKFSRSNRSASNTLTSRSSKKTAGNKTKRKKECGSTIPRVIMMTFHLWSERLIFTSEEVPTSKEAFASTAELFSVNFSLSPLLWNYGIAVTFCVLCTC